MAPIFSYFFLKHRAIVLGSAAKRVCLALALILPSNLSIELSDAENSLNLTPNFSAASSFEPVLLASRVDRPHLCYIF
ncbi:hypothetical protein [Microcoleus sp. D3_18_C4]|uniref:hypothetical protein n=1 Tax=Microcoleus sp. D3_18_C4 TaxID=3055335 RepID=UPI002FD0BD3E